MQRINHLLLRLLREEITPGEHAELEAWLAVDSRRRTMLAELQDPDEVKAAFNTLDRLDRQWAWRKLAQAADPGSAHFDVAGTGSGGAAATGIGSGNGQRAGAGAMRRIVRWAAAAVVAASLGTGAWWLSREHHPAGTVVARLGLDTIADIPAGSNRATLTLSGGTVIFLDSVDNGRIANQGGTRIMKTGDGQLVYAAPRAAPGAANMFNTLTTPRGGEYELKLPDGTRVWLNAASSITYPSAFGGKERRVKVTGEAYFEVAKDAGRPFHVETAFMQVQVLGTHFNINVYKDEPGARATLLEGKIAVDGLMLRPGQQADKAPEGGTVLNPHPDVDGVMAWRNGLFRFEHTDLRAVMRQLSRWYDVEVRYEPHVPPLTFGGKIKRDLSLSEVLLFLRQSGVHLRLEGKTLVVEP